MIDFDSVPVGSGGFDGIATLGGDVFLLDYINDDILRFDPITDTVVSIMNIDGLNPTTDLAGGLSAITGPDALLATDGLNFIVEIDPATGLVTSTFVTTPQSAGVAVLNGAIYLGRLNSPIAEVRDRGGVLLRNVTLPYGVSGLGGDDVPISSSSTGTLSGTSWSDLDGDGDRDTDDVGLTGRTIYVDLNRNGQLDSDEPTTLTNSRGEYTFFNVLAGDHFVAQLPVAGLEPTFPSDDNLGFWNVTVEAGSLISGLDFGNRPIAVSDFGDAPLSYRPPVGFRDASNELVGPRLGANRDGEFPGDASLLADRDDAAGVEVEDYAVTIGLPVASIADVRVNDGRATRSEITSIAVEFNSTVNVIPSDFVLRNVTTGQQVTGISVARDDSGGGTLATLTFSSGAGIISGDNPGVLPTLATGDYELRYRPDTFDNSFDVIPIDKFFRKYGDNNGERTVNLSDFAAFRSTFGT